MGVYVVLFVAGVLTILLPCILPLVPIVLGVSVTGQRRWRPLQIVIGMVIGFVLVTGVLQVVLSQFVRAADLVRIGSFYLLFLLGFGFATERRWLQILAALVGAAFFHAHGWPVMLVAAALGVLGMLVAGRLVTRIQGLGVTAQAQARTGWGDSPLTALVVGLTLGLVWVPCAGPALGFALALVRDQPGLRAFAALTVYAVGASLPLLAIGYGGQRVLKSARTLTRHSGTIKRVAGVVMVATAFGLQAQWFTGVQTWFGNRSWGRLGDNLEGHLVQGLHKSNKPGRVAASAEGNPNNAQLPSQGPAPELVGLGPWYNSPPPTLEQLRGKVVLVDFWTYSCINCLRTLPYLSGYWDRYKDQPFVLIGVHTPEFAFEKDARNVADAIKRLGIKYPVAQDNAYATWKAFSNQYWPAEYLIDAKGNIRLTHFGEGGYEEMDQAIRTLLAEMGAKPAPATASQPEQAKVQEDMSPETYLGSRSWQAFANAGGPPDSSRHHYTSPVELPRDHYALVGTWQLVDDEHQLLRSPSGEIRYHARASEVNLVLGVAPGTAPITADVLVDGQKTKTITIDHQGNYQLSTGAYGDHEIRVVFHHPGVAAYDFTFGAR